MSVETRHRIPAALAAVLVALGLLAGACGSDDPGADQTTAETETGPADGVTDGVTEDETDEAADTQDTESAAGPSVVLPTVSGSQVDFGSLEGTDTILWFWAPW